MGLLWSMLSQWVFRINPDNFDVPALLWAIVCDYVGWLLMFAFEPLLLHYWGTTLGKWVFGLSVRDEDGNKLSLRTAYARLWGVFGYGNCYGLPFVEWYYNYKCYRACTEEELPWDLENGCNIIVREREVRVLRVVLYVVLLALVNLAQYGIDLHAKMPPNRGDLTLEQFVENCNDYLKYDENLPPYVMSDGTWDADMPTGNWVWSLVDFADVSVETDENGYVKSVTVTADSQDGSLGSTERRTVYYAFAASYERWSSLYADSMSDVIDDGWDYDAPDTKNVKEAHLGGLDFRYEYEYSFVDTESDSMNGTMPYHSVLTITKE